MDFGTLLHVARKNSENNKNEGKFYSTKFAPPKKESKEKKLSDNIQKFLQKREQEEKERQREQKAKLTTLLALRDEKSKNKIRKMLKVTKSANKSVLDDAINTEHTAVTMQGPEQPDEDDYGYVSKEANAFYQKYIEKVKDVKEDKGFAPSRPHSLKDLSGTKERVKAAITKENDDKKNPARLRTSTSTSSIVSVASSSKDTTISSRSSTSAHLLYDAEAEIREADKKKREETLKKAKNRKAAPPPMDFHALMKLAEKKQHEPVEVLQPMKPTKKKEPERLFTLKEKQEWEERQQAKEARARRDRERNDEYQKNRKTNSTPQGRIPKLSQSIKSEPALAGVKKNTPVSSQSVGNVAVKSIPHVTNTAALTQSKTSAAYSPAKNTKLAHISTKSSASIPNSKILNTTKQYQASDVQKARQFPPADVQKTRQFPPADVQKTRQFPPVDVQKTRQFPPADVQKKKTFSPHDKRRPPIGHPGDNRKAQISKRRILDDDDDEYDSELDDFIDDGDCEEDYSSHIKAIFGYDKSKYRDLDDGDDTAMESNFAQVQREEFLSKKIGMQEDLDDMKMEAQEKKRKIAGKKRKVHD